MSGIETGAPFAPDWVSPPGDTIADVLEERGWTQAGAGASLPALFFGLSAWRRKEPARD